MTLLLFILVGILPLFTQSLGNNAQGRQLTEVTNEARQHLEALLQAPFDGDRLAVPDGDSELLAEDLWSDGERRWIASADFPAGETPLYRRTTRVRQFGVDAIGDGDLELEDGEALPGGTPPARVHLKEIEVRVESAPDAPFSRLIKRKVVTLRSLRSS
ncbi:MAG TPA: hypothetical protein VMT16_16995 [Thermoanaerobaculia bacterium]|nr:hypothetical protein [Thermoanaerobaculia bacterium]